MKKYEIDEVLLNSLKNILGRVQLVGITLNDIVPTVNGVNSLKEIIPVEEEPSQVT